MIERRLLVATGTTEYRHLPGSALSQVPSEIQRIVDVLGPLQYSRCLDDLPLNPSSMQLQDRLPRWLQQEVQPGDLIVFYYSGHGVRDGESFYLLTCNSQDSLLDSTAVSAEQLARWMTKQCKAAQILVILDTCYAGAGAADFARIAGKVCTLMPQGPAVAVIAAARPKEEAQQGAFSAALARALSNADGRLGASTQEFLAFDQVMEQVDQYLGRHHPSQTATWSSVNVRGRFRFFPNPQFKPEVPAGWDLELQRTLREHWVLKAMSTETSGRAWYFTGRTAALREIVSWLNEPQSDSRICVVTGGAGSGKSAVLARIVTLADRTYRALALSSQGLASLQSDTVPMEGSIHVAVHARRKLVADVVGLIGNALGYSGVVSADPGKLVEALAQRMDQTVIVIDALDESSEPDAIVAQIVSPLAALPQIRLLVGTRPDVTRGARRFRGLGYSTKEIDLDLDRYFDSHDVARYIERRLLAMEEWGRKTFYQERPETARLVAQAIANRSGRVFLVARTAVQSLLGQPNCIDTAKPQWIDDLPTGVEEAFRQFLSRFDGQEGWSVEKAKAILRPLAFAEGEGLPWATIWGSLANALSGIAITDEDIAYVRECAAAFIVEGLDDGTSVYRLYHESLAEWFRAETGDNVETQRRLAQTLYDLIPREFGTERPDWARAPHYVLTHLAAHAQAGDVLPLFCDDDSFVIYADPSRFVVVLQRSNDRTIQSLREVYLLAFNRLVQVAPEERASYLGLIAYQQHEQALAERFTRRSLASCWFCSWAHGGMVMPHRVLTGLPNSVFALAVAKLEGHPVIIAGTLDGTLHCFEAESGRLRGRPWIGHTRAVNAVVVGTVNGCPVVVSASDDRTLRRWNLETGQPIGEPLTGHTDSVQALAIGIVEGRPIVVSGGDDRTLRRWDLETGQLIGDPLTGHTHCVRALAVGMVDGRPVVASGGLDQMLRRWDLVTGLSWGEAVLAHPDPTGGWMSNGIRALAIGIIDDHSVVVSGGGDGTVRRWDLATGQQIGEPIQHPWQVSAVAVCMVDELSVVVAADGFPSSRYLVRCWNLATGELMGEPLVGHTSVVCAVATAIIDGRVAVVSGGADCTVRCWDFPRGPSTDKLLSDLTQGVAVLEIGMLDGRPIVVSAGGWVSDCTVRRWDLETGKSIGEELKIEKSAPAMTAKLGLLNGRSVGVSSGNDLTLHVWDLATGQPVGEVLTGDSAGVACRAMGLIGGRPVVISEWEDLAIRRWDLETGQPIGESLIGHTESILSMAVGVLDGRQVLVSGGHDKTVCRWDLETGQPIGEPLPHTGLTLPRFHRHLHKWENSEIGGQHGSTHTTSVYRCVKSEAVRLTRESGRPVAQVARELGITDTLLIVGGASSDRLTPRVRRVSQRAGQDELARLSGKMRH